MIRAADSAREASSKRQRLYGSPVNEMVLERHADDAALHQARVALRRLRSALSIWRDLLDDPVGETLRGELRWLSGVLGAARDLDVLIARTMPGALQDRLVADRADAYAAVTAALASERARRDDACDGRMDRDRPMASGPRNDCRPRAAPALSPRPRSALSRKIKRGAARDCPRRRRARQRIRQDAKKTALRRRFLRIVVPGRKQQRRRPTGRHEAGRPRPARHVERSGDRTDAARRSRDRPADTTLLGAGIANPR